MKRTAATRHHHHQSGGMIEKIVMNHMENGVGRIEVIENVRALDGRLISSRHGAQNYSVAPPLLPTSSPLSPRRSRLRRRKSARKSAKKSRKRSVPVNL